MNSKIANKDILKEKIGVAGCGNMGLPMLRSILAKNIDARGYDIENKESTLGGRFVSSKIPCITHRVHHKHKVQELASRRDRIPKRSPRGGK